MRDSRTSPLRRIQLDATPIEGGTRATLRQREFRGSLSRDHVKTVAEQAVVLPRCLPIFEWGDVPDLRDPGTRADAITVVAGLIEPQSNNNAHVHAQTGMNGVLAADAMPPVRTRARSCAIPGQNEVRRSHQLARSGGKVARG